MVREKKRKEKKMLILLILFLLYIMLLTLLIIKLGNYFYPTKSITDTVHYAQQPLLSSQTPNVQFAVNGVSTALISWDESLFIRLNFDVKAGSFDPTGTSLQVLKPGKYGNRVILSFTSSQLATTTGVTVTPLATPPSTFNTVPAKQFILSTTGTPITLTATEPLFDEDTFIAIDANGSTSSNYFNGYVDFDISANTAEITIQNSNKPITGINNTPNDADDYYTAAYYIETQQIVTIYGTLY